jgi:hypothetical protein
MTATALNHATQNANPAPAPRSLKSTPAAPGRRKLPAFPNETLYFEAKFIDNSQVVRAEDPGSGRHCWRAVFSVVTISAISAGLMLPSAFRMITGQKIVAERNEGKQLRAEIAELQAQVAKYSGKQHLEEYAAAQGLKDPLPTQVQHITPKGSFAKNSLPSGK